MSLLMCLNEEELDYMLRELHEGIYGSHVAKTSVALKSLRNDGLKSFRKQLLLANDEGKCT